MLRKKKTARGFTLVEIMVVVVILGLLVGLVGPAVFRKLGWGQKKIAETMCKQIWDDIILFESIQKVKVTDIRDLEQPVDGADEPWRTVNQDPWGNDYWLETDGGKRYVYSSGPDGQEGTEDDISWPRLDK